MPSPNKTKTTLKKEFLFCTFHEKFPPFTIPFDMPEPDTNYYMHFRFDFFLNKNRQNLFSPRIVLFFPFFFYSSGLLDSSGNSSYIMAQSSTSFFLLTSKFHQHRLLWSDYRVDLFNQHQECLHAYELTHKFIFCF